MAVRIVPLIRQRDGPDQTSGSGGRNV